jgi:predicted  nucleic acid-binding Zn-ribbon protein
MALLDNLLTLHRVDSQVRALRTRVTSAETYLNAQERQLALLARQKTELETQLKQLQASVHALEVEQSTANERVERLRGDLNTSTNDRQYKAILNEMKVLEGQRDDIVKRAIEEMQRVDETKKRLETHGATIVERQKVREVAKGKYDECMKDVGERLAELEAERGRAADLVPERERKLFDRVAEETEGEAMAEITIVSLRHREFACGSCNIEVPFETYARLSSNSNEAIQCKACTRILFLTDANRPADPKASAGAGTKATKATKGSEEDREKAALARDKAKFEKTKKL